jgi:hypothetical protein
MCWFRTLLLVLIVGPVWAIEDYIIGGGLEADSIDGLSGAVLFDVGLTEKTRFSMSFGKSQLPLPRGFDLETSYGDIGVDYLFDPFGVRFEIAYWGDNDFFDSVDGRGAVYWRGDKLFVSGDLEYRDFEFDVFRNDVLPGQDVRFHAKGLGLSASYRVNATFSLNARGIAYNYNVDLRAADNRRIARLLSFSRLSLINSLVDYRIGAGIAVDVNQRRWDFSYQTWRGAVGGDQTHSATIHFTTPIGKISDVQFGLGVDDSELYGSVTFFSVFLFFYGGA